MKLSTVVLGLFLIGSLVGTIGIIGTDERVTGETPCVDGMNRINLEGIMCEKTEGTFFGYRLGFVFLLLIPMVIWGAIVLLHDAKEVVEE